MKLSIIIPVYNVEQYLERCVESCEKQDVSKDDYEIIIVNDGSPDNSLLIAQELAEKYDNISVISQENRGLSGARNTGIVNAKGEYIWCIDSDDYIDSKLAELLFFLQTNPSLDIIAVQLYKVRETGQKVGLECEQPTVKHNVVMKGRDAVISGYNPSSVCALIVRKALMEKYDLYFYEGITHQDVELSYRLMAHADDVIFTDYVPYIYVLHPNSISQSVNPQKKIKYLSDEIIIMQSFKKLAEEFKNLDIELYDVIMRRVKDIHFGMVLNLHNVKKEYAPLGINAAVLQNMKEAGLYPIRTDLGSWKKNLLKVLLNQEWFLR